MRGRDDQSDDAPLPGRVLQKQFYQTGTYPRALSLQSIDGGKNVLATLAIGEQFLLDKKIITFRLFYLSAKEVTADQIVTNFGPNQNGNNFPYYQDLTSKAKWLVDLPVAGQTMTTVISGNLVSDGGWIYAVGLGVLGRVRAGATTAPVPIPTASEASAVPRFEVRNPQVSFSSEWADNLRARTYRDTITIAYLAPSPLDTFRYLQIWMFNYQNSQQMREGPTFSYLGGPGGQGTGTFYLETDDAINPTTGRSVYPAHDVVFYFVALSATFAHRSDFILPTQGQVVPIVGRGPQPSTRTPIPYVILRGGILGGMTPPISPLPSGQIKGAKIQITWTEINDQTIDHVNIYRANQGTVGTPVTNGMPATPFAVRTKDQIIQSGTNTWVDADFNDYRGGDPQYSPTNPPDDFSVVDPARFQYWLETVNLMGMRSLHPETTGVMILRGVDGTDTHPGATYRDNIFNCFWNCQFFSNVTVASAAVAPANQTRGAPNNANGDAYGKWDNDSAGTVGTVPQFVSDGTNRTGEVDIFANTSAAINDFVRIFNDSPRSVFVVDESLVSSVFIGYDGVGNAPSESIALGIAEVSGGVQIGGSYIIAYFPGSILGNVGTGGNPVNYVRIVGYGILATNTYDHVRFAIGLKNQVGGAASGMIRIKQPMVNGGIEVASWTATVRDQDSPGGPGTGGGGNPPPDGGQCPLSGTLVETIDGTFPIDVVAPGDMIWSPITKRVTKVVQNKEYPCSEIWSISTDAGTNLQASRDHPILMKGRFWNRFKRIREIRPNDKIMVYRHGVLRAETVKAVFQATNANGFVFMLTLETDHVYCANGVVSHNKDYGHQVP